MDVTELVNLDYVHPCLPQLRVAKISCACLHQKPRKLIVIFRCIAPTWSLICIHLFCAHRWCKRKSFSHGFWKSSKSIILVSLCRRKADTFLWFSVFLFLFYVSDVFRSQAISIFSSSNLIIHIVTCKNVKAFLDVLNFPSGVKYLAILYHVHENVQQPECKANYLFRVPIINKQISEFLLQISSITYHAYVLLYNLPSACYEPFIFTGCGV